MNNFHTVDIAGGKLVKCYHIFRVMILDFKQVCNLSVGFFGQIAADLNVDTLIAPYRNKINFFCFSLSDVNIVAFSAKLKIDNVFKHSGNGFRIEAHNTILDRGIGKIEFLLRFQNRFAL